MVTREPPPSQFYTGLVVDLYEPLAAHLARADEYVRFIDGAGQPVLELGCGTGKPLLELVGRGYDVDGVDASAEMLAQLRLRAEQLGLRVRVYEQEMQALSLPRRYRAIFLAGWTFTLLTSDADARRTLEGIHAHLEPGGSVLIPLAVPDPTNSSRAIGHARETALVDGTRLRFEVLSVHYDLSARRGLTRLRYSRTRPECASEILERDFLGSWWPPDMFRDMLHAAGFVDVRATRLGGGELQPGDSAFTFRARKAASRVGVVGDGDRDVSH